jgi:hypothetical protein
MLSHNVQAAFARHDLSQRLGEMNKAESAMASLQREHASADRSVGLWDKIWFFSNSPEQAEMSRLAGEIRTARAGLTSLKAALRGDINTIADEFPPVEIWQRIDECEGIARAELLVDKGLFTKRAPRARRLVKALEQLGHRILEIWVPDFDLEAMIAALRDQDRARELAAPTSDITKLDPNLGYAPITQEMLVELVAGAALQGGLFAAEDELARLQELEERHTETAYGARHAITAWASLNVFSESKEETAAAQAIRKMVKARGRATATEQENRLLLATFLDAYPPLSIHRQIGAVLGAIRALRIDHARHVDHTGTATVRAVVAPRAVVLHTIASVRKAFLRAFVGLPMPSLLQRDSGWSPQRDVHAHSPRNQLLRDFTRSMDRLDGSAALGECANHAAMINGVQASSRRLSKEISWLDRAVFWDQTDAERQALLVKQRRKFHRRALSEAWNQLVEIANTASRQQPPLYVRDLSVNCAVRISKIGTASGCTVNKERGLATEIMGTIRDVLGEAYGLRGDRSTFMHDVANAATRGPTQPQDPEIFRARSYPEAVELVAQSLRATSFAEDYAGFAEVSNTWQSRHLEMAEMKARISFWDWVNFFSDTPEESRRNELKKEISGMKSDFQKRSFVVNQRFDAALDYYPPARLYYSTSAVIHALGRVYAKWVTRTYTDSKGNTRTSTTCELYGKSEAIASMKRWNADLVRCFGALPDVHECLERWVGYGGIE